MKQYALTLTSDQLGELAYLAEKASRVTTSSSERAFLVRLVEKLDNTGKEERANELVKKLNRSLSTKQ